MVQIRSQLGGGHMNLARMTEVYRHSGREGLVAAIEDFSVATKVEMMADINMAPRKTASDKPRQDAVDSHAGCEACSF